MRRPTAPLRAARRWLRLDRAQRRAELDAFLLDRVLKRPILFEDDRGLRYLLYPGENAGVYLRSGGNYERAEANLCAGLLEPGMTAIDVGANIGLYSLQFAKLVGPTGAVHSFEPEGRNRERLRMNVALNGSSNVTIDERAVAAESGSARLNLFPAALGAWHSLGRPRLADPFQPGETIAPESSVEVATTTLDEYCDATGVDRVGLLKIDVEGAEVDVLRGAGALLGEGRVDAVLFEVSIPQIRGMGHDPDEAFSLLGGHGFRVFEIAPGGLGPETASASREYANYIALEEGHGATPR